MKLLRTLCLTLSLLLAFATTTPAQPAIEAGSHGYRFLLALPGNSTNFPGGFAFGRETYVDRNQSKRFLFSGNFQIQPITNASSNTGSLGGQFTGYDNEFSIALSRQWARAKWFSETVYSGVSHGPLVAYRMQRNKLESGTEFTDQDQLWRERSASKSDVFTIGWLVSLEAGWWFHDRVQLYTAWGLQVGFERSQYHSFHERTGVSEYYQSYDTNLTEIYFQTGTVAVGMSFLF